MKKLDWSDISGLVLAAVAVGIAVVLGPRIPDPVPTHWNTHGVVDGWTPKPLGLFLPAILTGGIALLLSVLPRISPRDFAMEPFARPFRMMKIAISGFLFLISAGSLVLVATGSTIRMDRVIVLPGIGLLFIVLGNFMGKVTRNFFVGIRTPWTLASEEVWLRTHRLGGRLFVAAGFVLVLAGLLGAPFWILFVAIGVAAILPAVYSFVIWRRLEPPAPPAESAG